MKQSAAKTLGVAALGAAIAAVGAGAAHAAPAVPDASQALETVTGSLPLENVTNVTKALPGAGKALEQAQLSQAQPALAAGLAAVQPAAEQALSHGPTKPVAGLLGGLPVQGLPTHGLPVNGLPIG
ncbi:ATP-binding protein [Streptomyces sp. DSM 15324]|uniref:ATP-binding protein n=1 Tax=Streptomyces sp. DSM 15324 TaxID=1739111 RepID=UPI000749F756|nr:ATP-binding protein [Streptomyces sp. DSM 15324]KUO11932.1 ATP-binding protein [Streptomyces sp. DSM 15324]